MNDNLKVQGNFVRFTSISNNKRNMRENLELGPRQNIAVQRKNSKTATNEHDSREIFLLIIQVYRFAPR